MALIELIVACAICAIIVMPVAMAVRNALSAETFARDAADLTQQTRFAMQRMVAQVQRTAPYTLPSKPSATTSADWLGAVTFCLNGSAQLIETTPADTSCAGTQVIADKVSGFSVQTFNAGAGAATVIDIQLTLTGAGGQSVALTSRTRLGGGTL